jgi:hypothetical protein
MSKDLMTAEAILDWAEKDPHFVGHDAPGADREGFADDPADLETAAYLAECVRLRQRLEAVCTRGNPVRRLPATCLKAASCPTGNILPDIPDSDSKCRTGDARENHKGA